MRIALSVISVQEVRITLRVFQAATLPPLLNLHVRLAKRASFSPITRKILVLPAPRGIFALLLPSPRSNAVASLFTALQKVRLSTLRLRDTTPPQLPPPTKRESANCLARLVSLVWEESSLSASRVLPTSPTLLEVPASPAQRVPLGPTKLQPAPPQPTPSVKPAPPALRA